MPARNKENNYKCPRCGYNTYHKACMRKHLYSRNTVCQGLLDPSILLDDTMKEHIMNNRIYHKPKEEKPTTIINNYNQINNLVQQMDAIDKIQYCNDYNKKELIDFEDAMEDKYTPTATKLNEDKLKGFQLVWGNLLEMIDDALFYGKNVDKFNFLYDVNSNKIKVYCGGEWKSMLFEIGVQFMLSVVQSFYLNSYECYVIRNIESNSQNNFHAKAEYRDRLVDYYKFLVCFDIKPFSSAHHDLENLLEEDMAEKYYNLFLKTKEGVTARMCQQVQRKVYSIIKEANKTNIQDLNKSIMEIIKVDTEFKTKFLGAP